MSRIGISYRPSYRPTQHQGVGSKTARIDELKAEIANIKQQAQQGIISQEEAQSQIAVLEAKINDIENGYSNIIESPTNVESLNSENNINQVNDTGAAEGQNDGNDSQEEKKEDSQDSYFEQQALYNKVFHNL